MRLLERSVGRTTAYTVLAGRITLALGLLVGVGCGAHAQQKTSQETESAATMAPFSPFHGCPGDKVCQSRAVKPEGNQNTKGASLFYLPYIFYRDLVSPTDGPRCLHYPTCSMYAMQAVRRRGPFVGAIMALDRITSPAGISSAIREQPIYLHHGTARFLDPVEANDFWMEDLQASSEESSSGAP